jgi:dTDP-glucose pyrophosphorylase
LFRALPFVGRDEVACVGLPDTIWFPEDGLRLLDHRGLSFLLFPVSDPSRFDAVEFDPDGMVTHIDVKSSAARSHWIWGAFKITGNVLAELHALWSEPERGDEYIGTLVNAFLARGGNATGWPIGNTYMDVGTLAGYREALRLLDGTGDAAPPERSEASPPLRASVGTTGDDRRETTGRKQATELAEPQASPDGAAARRAELARVALGRRQ